MKSMGFDKVKLFDPKLVRQVANEHIRKIVDYATGRIASKGLDANGRVLKKYSSSYASQKARGFKRTKGKGTPKTSKMAYLSQKSYQTYPPNLMVTGTTLRNLAVRIWLQDRYCIGWNREAGAILGYQKDKGRDVVSGIPKEEFEWCQDRFDYLVDQELTKIKDVNITIGK